ncbi:MAG: hypothetical protein LUJ25_08095 [Firmicutes bacterium]|nr:hypothetical protein [Bacillota bacterium]
MNLHELPEVCVQAGDSKLARQGVADGKETLLPMFPVLADDMFDIVFVDQIIPFHDSGRGVPAFDIIQDLLLVCERDLRIRDNQGQEEGMGSMALPAQHALDGQTNPLRHKLYLTCVMAVTDQAAPLATGTRNHMELDLFYCVVIKILGKLIAISG